MQKIKSHKRVLSQIDLTKRTLDVSSSKIKEQLNSKPCENIESYKFQNNKQSRNITHRIPLNESYIRSKLPNLQIKQIKLSSLIFSNK